MKRAFLVFLSAVLSIALFSGCASNVTDTVSKNNNPNRTINGSLKSFNASTLDGVGFTSGDLAKYDITVINFWGTYCGPCINEMPDLASFKQTLPSNINFITFCVDAANNEDAAQSIIDNAGLAATVITAADGDFIEVLNQVKYIPTTLFIDKDGKIVGTEIIGGVRNVDETFTAHLNEALAESGAS